jgi:hypothetical protein
LWTIDLRKRFIKRALRSKYRRFLRMPEWTDSEPATLGASLQPSHHRRADLQRNDQGALAMVSQGAKAILAAWQEGRVFTIAIFWADRVGSLGLFHIF